MRYISYSNLEDQHLSIIKNHERNFFDTKEFDYINVCSSIMNDTLVAIIGLKAGEENVLPHIRKLKECFPSIPFILVSNSFINNVGFWCLRHRIWDYIILPAESDYFLYKLKALIAVLDDNNALRKPEFPSSTTDLNLLLGYTDNVLFNKTKNAVDYIHSNYGQKIEMNRLSNLCNLTDWKFTKLFKFERGLTPREYIKRYRISEAKGLLLRTDSPVQQIAFAVGYDDCSYFCRLFKELSGQTPKNYRVTNSIL